MQSKIFVAQHLHSHDMSTEAFQFTQVGKAYNSQFLVNTDCRFTDNISGKNPTWSELTLQYHMWKHETGNYKNIGLAHYRRHFNPYGIEKLTADEDYPISYEYGKTSRPQIEFSEPIFNKILSNETTDLLDLLVKDNETLVTLQPFMKTNKWSLWTMAENDWIPVRTIVEFFEWCKRTMDPHVFYEFDHLINQSNEHFCNNMIYCSSELFARYSKWLFDLLFGFEMHLKSLEKQLGKQLIVPRMFGYFSEYMLRPWCIINFIDVEHVESLCFTNLKTDTRI